MDWENAFVSIILINHNGIPWLEESIRSVLGQNHRHLELVAVDDCSDDGSWETMCRIAKEDSRLLPIKTERNLGISGARNFGLDRARGDFVAFLDSDDAFLPNAIGNDIKDYQRLSEQWPDLGLIMTDAWVASEKGKIRGRYMPRKYWGRDIVESAPNWTLPSAWFAKREGLPRFFSPYRFGEATLFVERVRRISRVAFVGRADVLYRLRMHSATNRNAAELLTAIKATERTIVENRLDNPVPIEEVEPPSRAEVSAWSHGRTAKCAFVNGCFLQAALHAVPAAFSDFPRFVKKTKRVLLDRSCPSGS